MDFNRLRGPLVSLALAAAASCTSGDSGLGPVPPDCSEEQVVSLAVGESVELDGSNARSVCVGADTEGQSFVLVGMNRTNGGTVTLTANGANLGAAAEPGGSAAAVAARSVAGMRVTAEHPPVDVRFHQELRRWESRRSLSRAGPSLTNGATERPGTPRAPGRSPTVGAQVSLNAQSQPDKACSDPILVTGRVRAVSDEAVVIADVENPMGGFSTSDYQHFAATFDTLIAPVSRQYFGNWSDIDGNDRTILFFTKEVNAIAPSQADAFTAGFFHPRDLFSTMGSNDCDTSNEAEMLYLLVPDASGQFGSEREYDFVRDFTIGTIVHELQHLINASTRLFESGAMSFEETWLNEALSHIAEELVFYRASGLEPGRDLDVSDLARSERSIAAFEEFQLFNFLRYTSAFLPDTDTNTPFDSDVVLATRGAAWNFLRYVADRRTGSDEDLFRSLVNASATGVANLASSLGGTATLYDWLSDWGVAVYADDRVPGLPVRHLDRSWNHPNIWVNVRPLGTPPTYPVGSLTLADGTPLPVSLAGGGAAYYTFGVTPGEVGQVTLTVNGAAPPPTFRATLLRTR